jgi:hypothetical protein
VCFEALNDLHCMAELPIVRPHRSDREVDAAKRLYVGAIRIELLVESVSERWVCEECPGRFLAEDVRTRAMRRS